jgi:hypothetical protein
MEYQAKTYRVLSYLIDQKSRSKPFYLQRTDMEYHLLTDGDMVLLLTYERGENEYTISTMNLVGQWIDISLTDLLATTSSPHYELMWRHLNYFSITPDMIYDLYASEGFQYEPSYEAENNEEEE